MPPELFTLYFHLAFVVILFSVVYFILTKPFAKRTDEKKEMDAVSRYLLCIGFLLIIFSFFAPYFIIQYLTLQGGDESASPKSIYDISGPLGDTIGGVMNPFVAMAGVIVTGLAFYMQYKANKVVLIANDQLKEQFKLQQFESQFYEMLRLHKENVNEMEINGYEYSFFNDSTEKVKDSNINKRREDKVTYGRKVFVTMVKEICAIYLVVKRAFVLSYPNKIKENDVMIFMTDIDRKKYFRLAYEIFLEGYDSYLESIIHLKAKFDEVFLNNLKLELKSLRSEHMKGELSTDIHDSKRKKNYLYGDNSLVIRHFQGKLPTVDLKLYFNYKPFSGHQSRLGHYYRHMFNLVKHVVHQSPNLLSYEEKRKYLKIFRAQLSNHEIVLLYYNWLGGYGKAWEEKRIEGKKRKRYFTDYRILHNLDKKLVMAEFDPTREFKKKRYREFVYKGNNPSKDKLFAIDGIQSILNDVENQRIKNGVENV
ncbi:putative phage abortive infection protein [Sphingobacterium chuzhouense]|uniref:Phage abortive infection protein n=1 Tax=Sphingobacterium chuzhouense TaxID=1742264 RepID=A0ABR7XR24_9SPHI|nr:putative phage abortive infection protein [Sphingobacterium chuzhouense]MBD1421629.1 putative phage abortive infection protein [Sphingobacterium chuzhouense]